MCRTGFKRKERRECFVISSSSVKKVIILALAMMECEGDEWLAKRSSW